MAQWQLVAHKEARTAMRAMGAVGAANAVPYERLPGEVQDTLHSLVESGLVREGASGTYYLYERERMSRGRIAAAILFWLLVVLIPVFIIQLSYS